MCKTSTTDVRHLFLFSWPGWAWPGLVWLEQESAELSEARTRVDDLLEELEGAKEGLQRSSARVSELQRRHLEGR